jgi:hypothetical protein
VTPQTITAQKVTIGSAITVTKLAVLSLGNGPNAALALYANQGTRPVSVVAQTGTFALTSGANEVPVLSAASLPPGTYWLAANFSDAPSIACSQGSVATDEGGDVVFGSSWPDPWTPPPLQLSSEPLGLYLVGIE